MGKYGRQHIGKTFNDGKLTVVDGGDKGSYVKVKCSVCAGDPELFGDGVFEATFGNINSGRLPCGCAKNTRWSLSQYAVRINRKIVEGMLPTEFVRFGVSSTSINQTPVVLFCNRECVEYTVISINSFFNGSGNVGKIRTTDERISQYNVDNPRYTIWDTGNKVGKRKTVIGFHCKICEAMGFESVFVISSDNLFDGKIPCYCSKKQNISGDHVVETSKRTLLTQDLNEVIVIGAYQKSTTWYTVFLCKIHGIYSRAYSSINCIGCACRKCAPPSFGYKVVEKGYLYLLDIKSKAGIVLGYGITNNINNRMKDHKRNLKSIEATITNIQVFEGSGTAVLAVENAIKALHPTGLLDCEGFRRESIGIDMKDKVLEKCSKLKELDNVDKLI